MLAVMARRCGSGSLITIQGIANIHPISNTKDESDRSEDDPRRSEVSKYQLRLIKEGPKRSEGDPTGSGAIC